MRRGQHKAMVFKKFLNENPTARAPTGYKGNFKGDFQKPGRNTFKKYQEMWNTQNDQKWWTKPSDIGSIEAKIKDNTSREWKKKQDMSKEALPLLRNKKLDETLKISGQATHLANVPALTEACEARRVNKNYDIKASMDRTGLKCGTSVNPLTYSISYGTVFNAKDKDDIYHVEYDQQYTPFTCKFAGVKILNPIAVPGLNFDYVHEPKYASLLPSFRTVVDPLIGDNYTNGSQQYRSVMDLVKTLDTDAVADVQFEEPDISHAHTADYTIYTCSTSCKKIVHPSNMVKIRRRMVIASMNYMESPVNIPLAEEIFIETLTRDTDAVFDNENAPYKTDGKSFVLNFNLISDSFKTSDEGAECNSSTVHFFGKNAFSMLVPDFCPANKNYFDTGHETGMYLLGWLTRQLDAAALGTSKTNMFKAFLPSGHGVPELKNTFIGQQNAGNFFKTEKKKLFYTKTWLASPTLVVIAITPVNDTSRNMVMVWSAGRYIDGDAIRSIAVDVQNTVKVVRPGTLPPIKTGRPLVVDENGMPIASRAGPLFAKFTSALPLDLELELQTL